MANSNIRNEETPFKSYVLWIDPYHKTYHVNRTHFLPGYTIAHKASEIEALNYEIEKRRSQILDLQIEIDKLRELRKPFELPSPFENNEYLEKRFTKLD